MADGFFFFFFCVSPADPVGRIQFHLNVKWLCGKCFSHIIIPTSTDLDPVPQQPRMMTCFCVWQEDFVRIPLFKYFTIKAHFLRQNRQLRDRFKGCDAVRWFSNYHDMSEEVVRRACVQSFHLFDTYRWVSWSGWDRQVCDVLCGSAGVKVTPLQSSVLRLGHNLRRLL